jgi:hypothetical protein
LIVRAIVLAALVLIAGPAWAADRCLSKSEARKLWPDRHLYWSTSGGQRCWSNRRGRRVAVARVTPTQPNQPPPPAPVPLPFILPPAEIATAPPPRLALADRWEWIMEARAALHDDEPKAEPPFRVSGPIYSTFAGPEPDVWPAPPSNKDAAWMVLLFGLAAVEAVLIWKVVGR